MPARIPLVAATTAGLATDSMAMVDIALHVRGRVVVHGAAIVSSALIQLCQGTEFIANS